MLFIWPSKGVFNDFSKIAFFDPLGVLLDSLEWQPCYRKIGAFRPLSSTFSPKNEKKMSYNSNYPDYMLSQQPPAFLAEKRARFSETVRHGRFDSEKCKWNGAKLSGMGFSGSSTFSFSRRIPLERWASDKDFCEKNFKIGLTRLTAPPNPQLVKNGGLRHFQASVHFQPEITLLRHFSWFSEIRFLTPFWTQNLWKNAAAGRNSAKAGIRNP